MLRYLTLLLLGLTLALLVSAALLWSWWQRPLPLPAGGVVVRVAPGESLGHIAGRLAGEGVLRHPTLLKVLGRLSGADQSIRHGEYRLLRGSTAPALLELLQSGDTIKYLVTLPEGIRLSEALDVLAASDGVRAVLSGPDDPRLLALVAPASTAEGYFLPETYQYQRDDTDLEILSEAHRMMRSALAQAWARKQSGLPYDAPYEVLIMASIIEKETGLASERPLIGGVFVRRLLKGMRLQTDPTVIYGLGEEFQGNLQRSHLRDASNAYNSYRHAGLPPGPIALPGRASLMAAVQPATGDALYFVARGDGSHAFSATLAEHERAVREYQLQRRADYRSRPKETSR